MAIIGKQQAIDTFRKNPCPDTFNNFSPELQVDKEVAMACAHISGLALNYFSPVLQDDREVVEAAMLHSPASILYASPRLRNDVPLLFKAVEKQGLIVCNLFYENDIKLGTLNRHQLLKLALNTCSFEEISQAFDYVLHDLKPELTVEEYQRLTSEDDFCMVKKDTLITALNKLIARETHRELQASAPISPDHNKDKPTALKVRKPSGNRI